MICKRILSFVAIALLSLFVFQLIYYAFLLKNEAASQSKDENIRRKEAAKSLPQNLQKLFDKFCNDQTDGSNLNLNCYCKPHPLFRCGCWVKVEMLNDEPLLAVFKGYFKPYIATLRNEVERGSFVPVRFGNEYGFKQNTFFQRSENGVLEFDNLVTVKVYDGLMEVMGTKKMCWPKKPYMVPKATIVRYPKDGFFNVHYDANNFTLENTFGLLVARLYHNAISALEMCRHRYKMYNTWVCLYKLYTGSLLWTDYWENYWYGPRLITALVQLSEVAGGETFFPHLGISVHTEPGDLFIWANTDDHWIRYDSSAHGACPVKSKEKLIVVVFVPAMCNKIRDIKRAILYGGVSE